MKCWFSKMSKLSRLHIRIFISLLVVVNGLLTVDTVPKVYF
jgi:hypothetical protein